jgi:hypothetical protein
MRKSNTISYESEGSYAPQSYYSLLNQWQSQIPYYYLPVQPVFSVGDFDREIINETMKLSSETASD